VTAGDRNAVARALGVLATAVRLGVVVDEPRGVKIRGNHLGVRELIWLVEGFGATETELLPPNDVEVRGTLLGRVYRLQVSSVRHHELQTALAKAGA
jgi:hypothetical protein